MISLLRDEVSRSTDQPFNVRIESEYATFYQVNRVAFWKYVNSTPELQNYVKNYYRKKLSENILRLQRMVMNGKKEPFVPLSIVLLICSDEKSTKGF